MTQLLSERRGRGSMERRESMPDVADRLRALLDQTFADSPWSDVVREAAAWVPDVDIEEEDDAYVIEANLPGVDRKNVSVELVGRELVITGKIEVRERKGVLRRRGRPAGDFEVRVVLPDRVDADGITAELERGVLTVRVPKSEAAARRKIEVKS